MKNVANTVDCFLVSCTTLAAFTIAVWFHSVLAAVAFAAIYMVTRLGELAVNRHEEQVMEHEIVKLRAMICERVAPLYLNSNLPGPARDGGALVPPPSALRLVGSGDIRAGDPS